MLSETKVLISGGGITGLVLAVLLKQKGYAPTVYERNDQPTSLGRGLWLIKYGIYDRPALNWHKGRVVLIGDAAHLGSNHAGQGANQAIEDVYHLRLQVKYNPSAVAPSLETLESVFDKLEQIRIPLSSAIVKKAREIGEACVTSGVEACCARNAMVSKTFGLSLDASKEERAKALKVVFIDYLEQPFISGKSEI